MNDVWATEREGALAVRQSGRKESRQRSLVLLSSASTQVVARSLILFPLLLYRLTSRRFTFEAYPGSGPLCLHFGGRGLGIHYCVVSVFEDEHS